MDSVPLSFKLNNQAFINRGTPIVVDADGVVVIGYSPTLRMERGNRRQSAGKDQDESSRRRSEP
jgi:hypothetical protein